MRILLLSALLLTSSLSPAYSANDCAPEVQEKLATQAVNEINGMSDLIDSEIGRPSKLSGIDCIDQILNTTAGIGGSFNIPSFSSIMNKVTNAARNAVCSQVDGYYDQAVGMIDGDLSSKIASTPMDGFVPTSVTRDLGGSIGLDINRGGSGSFTPVTERIDYQSMESLGSTVENTVSNNREALEDMTGTVNDLYPDTSSYKWMY